MMDSEEYFCILWLGLDHKRAAVLLELLVQVGYEKLDVSERNMFCTTLLIFIFCSNSGSSSEQQF